MVANTASTIVSHITTFQKSAGVSQATTNALNMLAAMRLIKPIITTVFMSSFMNKVYHSLTNSCTCGITEVMKKKLAVLLLPLAALVAWIPVSDAMFGRVVYEEPKTSTTAPIETPKTVQLDADTLFDLVNQERVKVGVKPLVRDARLDRTAKTRSDDMLTRNYDGHYDPITGANLVNISKENPGMCIYASENIANTPSFDDRNQRTVNNWLDSKSHHDAMLDPRYSLTGMSVSGTRVVQHFCQQ